MQMELIDLQNNTLLNEKYNNCELSVFYSKYMENEKYLNLRNRALKIMFFFGSTCTCKHIFHE